MREACAAHRRWAGSGVRDLPRVGSVLVVSALMLAQSLLVNEHSAAPAVIALKEHFVDRVFLVVLELKASDTRSKLLTKLTIIKRGRGQT